MHGRVALTALSAGGAVVLLRLVTPVPTGRRDAGGLWLTPAGLEHCTYLFGWSLARSAVRGDRRPDAPCGLDRLLPRHVTLGVRSVAPVVLTARPGARPCVEWTPAGLGNGPQCGRREDRTR